MGKLVINHNLVTPEKAEALVSVCPFDAISYADGKLDSPPAVRCAKCASRRVRAW